MLNSISWQQYVVAVLLMTLAWYAYVGLRYFGPEISRVLWIKPKRATALPEVATDPASLMAPSRPQPGTGQQNAEELIFSVSSPDDISDQTLPKGPSDDLLADGHSLINAFTENGDKEEFLNLLGLLVKRYDVFADEISLPSVIASFKASANKLPFSIIAEEWPQNFES